MISRAPEAAAVLLLLIAPPARAGGFWKPFIAGTASGFAIHEGNHLILDLAFDAEPRLKGVRPNSKAARWGSRVAKAAFLGVIAFKE